MTDAQTVRTGVTKAVQWVAATDAASTGLVSLQPGTLAARGFAAAAVFGVNTRTGDGTSLFEKGSLQGACGHGVLGELRPQTHVGASPSGAEFTVC